MDGDEFNWYIDMKPASDAMLESIGFDWDDLGQSAPARAVVSRACIMWAASAVLILVTIANPVYGVGIITGIFYGMIGLEIIS